MALEAKTLLLTPSLAREFLQNVAFDNESRMPPSQEKRYVSLMAVEIKAGRWELTHQGMLRGKNGILLDGRHRCKAVIEADTAIEVQMTEDETRESTRGLPVDIGKNRSTDFILGLPKRLVATANFALRFGMSRATAPTMEEIKNCSMLLKPYYDKLPQVHSRLLNSADIQLAGCLTLATKNASDDYLKNIFMAIARSDPRALPQYPYSFWRQVTNEKMTNEERLLRALSAFTEDKADLEKLQIKDYDVRRLHASRLILKWFIPQLYQPFKKAEAPTVEVHQKEYV